MLKAFLSVLAALVSILSGMDSNPALMYNKIC